LESIPSRVFTSCRPADPLGPAPTPTRFHAPSTASPGLAPYAAARPPSAAVPLSRFHNASAVSWQARASRPCFMPHAARGVLPSELYSSPGSRAPLGVALLPCSSPPGVRPRVRTRSFHSGFHRLPRLTTRWPGSPPELGHRFHRACACAPIGFPGALTLPAHLGVATFRLRLLRSLDPPAKPYRRRRRSDVPRPLLPWASPLQSLSPIEPRDLMTLRTVPSAAR
jgi:hypothetical protein